MYRGGGASPQPPPSCNLQSELSYLARPGPEALQCCPGKLQCILQLAQLSGAPPDRVQGGGWEDWLAGRQLYFSVP